MGNQAKLPNGLTAKQQIFAHRLAQGCTQADAYRIAYNIDPEAPLANKVYSSASKLARHPKVIEERQKLLDAALLEDIDNPQRALVDLLNDLEHARQDQNWSAVANLTKTRIMVLGMLRTELVIRDERMLSDDDLIRQVAQGNPIIEHQLNQILIPSTFNGKAEDAKVIESVPSKDEQH